MRQGGNGATAHRGSSGAAGGAGKARGPAKRRWGSPAPEVEISGVGDAAELLAPCDSMERTTTSWRSSGSRRRGGAVAVGAGLRQRVHGGFGHGGERARRGVGGANGRPNRSGRHRGGRPAALRCPEDAGRQAGGVAARPCARVGHALGVRLARWRRRLAVGPVGRTAGLGKWPGILSLYLLFSNISVFYYSVNLGLY